MLFFPLPKREFKNPILATVFCNLGCSLILSDEHDQLLRHWMWYKALKTEKVLNPVI